MHVTAIIAAGGTGRRLGAAVPKQLLDIGGRSLLEHSVDAFATHPAVTEVIVVLPAALVDEPPAWLASASGVRVVAGGERRQDSVANAFDRVSTRSASRAGPRRRAPVRDAGPDRPRDRRGGGARRRDRRVRSATP